MNTHTYEPETRGYDTTFNPETGRRIRVGGTLFCQLLYDRYDYLNGGLVRRVNVPPPEEAKKYYNTVTNRYIRVDGRRYNKLIRSGWKIEEDHYIFPPNQKFPIK